jgi:hypothetical protein
MTGLCKRCGAYWDCGHGRPTQSEDERADMVQLPGWEVTMQATARSLGMTNEEFSKIARVPIWIIEGRYHRTEDGLYHEVKP